MGHGNIGDAGRVEFLPWRGIIGVMVTCVGLVAFLVGFGFVGNRVGWALAQADYYMTDEGDRDQCAEFNRFIPTDRSITQLEQCYSWYPNSQGHYRGYVGRSR